MRATPVATCLVMVISWGSLRAQDSSFPRWVVSAGTGVAFRTENGSSLGGQLRVSRVFQPTTSLFLEPGLTWHGYTRSSQFNDICPIEGCPPVRRDAISLMGLELGGAYRKAEAENPVYPVGGIGVYRISSPDTSGAGFGANVGLAFGFHRSGLGPALDIRYFRIFGGRRFRSLLPISLRWSF